jgi:hypothetical protein
LKELCLKEVPDDRYRAMTLERLLDATKAFLKNVGRLTSSQESGPDGELRILLVPELWERLIPGTRYELRRITCTLAEHDPDRRSALRGLLSAESIEDLRTSSNAIREAIDIASRQSIGSLIERVRFACAGTEACKRWQPEDHVYEPAFVYRLVPALVRRILASGANHE